MTYGEAVRIALLKADAEKDDFDSGLFAPAADEAQKKIAYFGRHIKKRHTLTIEKAPVEIDLGELNPSAYEIKGIVKRGSKDSVDYYFIDETHLSVNDTGTFDIHYYAKPHDITDETEDDYVFEVPDDTHVAIPFYIAYELTKTDDEILAQMSLNEWNRYMSLFDDKPFVIQRRIENKYMF